MLLWGPLLVPLLTAAVTAALTRAPRAQQALSVVGATALLACAIGLAAAVVEGEALAVAVGGWQAPYGIELVADRASAPLLIAASALGLGVLIYSLGGAGPAQGRSFHPLVHGLLAAAGGAFLTADLFNLYVWFELMLIVVLGMLVQGGERRHLEAAFKYFAMNMVGTLLILAAVGLLYGATGQLNFAALADAARRPQVAGAVPVYVAMLSLGLLLKAGAFPLFFWLPASYHSLPTPLLALVGGLVTKVAAYALLRLFGDVFAAQPSLVFDALGWIAVVTMVSGVLGAAYHWDLRRILSFHIISQIGYLLLAVALASAAARTAGLFFLVHNILAKSALFLIAGMMARAAGHHDLRRMGGLHDTRPLLSTLFLIAASSLVGIPPSSGFWGKLLLVEEAFAQGRYAWGGFALAVGALTLYSMVKIWLEGFWKPAPQAPEPSFAGAGNAWSYAAVLGLVALLVALGLYPEPLVRLVEGGP